MNSFNFDGLFILDLANNHQGDMAHARGIVQAVGDVVRARGVRAALKFQFRDLDTLVHPAFKEGADNKHIPRFISTRLRDEDFAALAESVRKQGMITMATPFDEASVDLLLRLSLDVIKIASCSAMDRPLLERVAEANCPVVVSTGGLNFNQIDRLVSFLEHRRVHFALMYCVALYPTPNNKFHLNQIAAMKERYPKNSVGFSSHDEPENFLPVRVAYGKGATLFERHIGMERGPHKLNAYSSTPEQIGRWLDACREAATVCGGEHRPPASTAEIASLRSLMRGVYAKRGIRASSTLTREDVFFAMPLQEKQLAANDWVGGLVADQDYASNAALSADLEDAKVPEAELIHRIMLQIKGMLNNARIFIGPECSVEISHHYGLDRFREFGCVIVDCINRTYCKKLINLLPRQKHPYHYHEKKEETFQLLYGDMEVELAGHRHRLQPGDTRLVQHG